MSDGGGGDFCGPHQYVIIDIAHKLGFYFVGYLSFNYVMSEHHVYYDDIYFYIYLFGYFH